MERAVYAPESRTRVILIAPDEQAAIQRHYATPDERFHLVPPILPDASPGPPWTPAHRRSVREQFGFRADTLAVLLVATSLRTKGADRALQAIDRLPPGLAGVDADRRRRGRRRLAATHARRRARRVPGSRDDLPELMRAADLLIHPARIEMAGKVLVEAIQQGLPVLCSGVAGYAAEVERAEAGKVLPEPFRPEDARRGAGGDAAGAADRAVVVQRARLRGARAGLRPRHRRGGGIGRPLGTRSAAAMKDDFFLDPGFAALLGPEERARRADGDRRPGPSRQGGPTHGEFPARRARLLHQAAPRAIRN